MSTQSLTTDVVTLIRRVSLTLLLALWRAVECGQHPDAQPRIRGWNTSSFIGGETWAGFVSVGLASTHPQELFYWKVVASKPSPARGLIIFLAGGPGLASTPYFFSLGPSNVIDNKRLVPNPHTWSKTLPEYDIVFIDAPAGVGYSALPAGMEISDMKISDEMYAKAVSDAVLQFAPEGSYASKGVVLVGESYGSKYATLVADQLWTSRTSFPLRGLCLSAVLLDRVAEAHGWVEAFGRLLGEEAALKLTNAPFHLIDLEKKLAILSESGSLKEVDEHIGVMWESTEKALNVKNQHDLSLKYRDKKDLDTGGPLYWCVSVASWLKQKGSKLLLAAAGHSQQLPVFIALSSAVFKAFGVQRLEDATPKLARLIDKGAMVLVATAEWDGMCTIEGTTHWLQTNFPGVFNEISTDQCEGVNGDMPSDLQRELEEAKFVHVIVRGSGHTIAHDCPDTLGKILQAFLSKPFLVDSTNSSQVLHGFPLITVLLISVSCLFAILGHRRQVRRQAITQIDNSDPLGLSEDAISFEMENLKE